jgi:CheY-like chemotaxis protein
LSETGPSTQEPERTHSPQPHRPVILVIDDELGVHEACRLLLAEQYDLLEAHDGPSAFTILDSHNVDLVLLDLRLPGVDGLEVLAQLSESRPQLRVIVLTAVMSVRIAVEAMKIGAFHYLTKPFSGEELCLLIEAALPRDPDHACLWDRRHQASPYPQRPGMGMLFVGSELAPLVTLKLMLERHVTAEVALNAPIALRWISKHFFTLPAPFAATSSALRDPTPVSNAGPILLLTRLRRIAYAEGTEEPS